MMKRKTSIKILACLINMFRVEITGNILLTLVAVSRPALRQKWNFTQMGKGIISNMVPTQVAASRAAIKQNLNLLIPEMGKGTVSVIACQPW